MNNARHKSNRFTDRQGQHPNKDRETERNRTDRSSCEWDINMAIWATLSQSAWMMLNIKSIEPQTDNQEVDNRYRGNRYERDQMTRPSEDLDASGIRRQSTREIFSNSIFCSHVSWYLSPHSGFDETTLYWQKPITVRQFPRPRPKLKMTCVELHPDLNRQEHQ